MGIATKFADGNKTERKGFIVNGFTIVELLIVIVIIGILAAIVIVAYNGITTRAQTSSVVAELKQWEQLFSLYKAQYGNYPQPAAAPTTDGGPGVNVVDYYCLGTGFPVASGTPYCYAYNNPPYQVEESRGATIMTELAKVGNPPKNSGKYMYGNVLGPVLRWVSATDIRLFGIFPPGTDCASMNLVQGYVGSARQECYIKMT